MMEKKTYVKPTVLTVAIETNVLMAASFEQKIDDKPEESGDVNWESKRHSFNVFDDDEEYE